jgi:hypothetical protein
VENRKSKGIEFYMGGKTLYATNRLSLTAPEVRQLYRLRQEIEEVIRIVKSQLNSHFIGH